MAWAADRRGPERVRGAYAWRTLRRVDARLIFNSDLPGSDWSLFYSWHSALLRQDKSGAQVLGWFPDQRMSAEETVRGHSSWAAFAGFDDASAGVIALGKRADLTAVSVDPFRGRNGSELFGGGGAPLRR
jgi:predicted amidohydrolase YtcJ